ncbi:MAG: hypothetical protein N3B18_05160 [Desulfobacterota bacterium]|nr:hypothetical protein [Thermodesulfobacteriota bacterium]
MEQNTYKTPLAAWARALEIFIPAYMFGKSWGIADEKTVGLFRAQFPAFCIDMAEKLKGFMRTDIESLKLLVATAAGAAVGFGVLALLACVMHFVIRDRAYINSLRFTAVTLIPIAVLNGTLSHGVKTLVEKMGTQSAAALYKSAVITPWSYFTLNMVFYLIGLWFFGRRVGIQRQRRKYVMLVGIGFMALYLACGLMITPGEWQALLPELQRALSR